MEKITVAVKKTNKKLIEVLTEKKIKFETFESLEELKNLEGEYVFVLGDEAVTINDDYLELLNYFALEPNKLYLSTLLNLDNGKFEVLNKRPIQTGEFETLISYFEAYLTGSLIPKEILNKFEFSKELKHLVEFEFIKRILEDESYEIKVIPKFIVETSTKLNKTDIKQEVDLELKKIFGDKKES